MISLQKDHILLDPTGNDISNCNNKGKSQVNYFTNPLEKERKNKFILFGHEKNLNLHFQFPSSSTAEITYE